MPEPPELPEIDPSNAINRSALHTNAYSNRSMQSEAFETRLCRMPAKEYFTDPCATPSLSASIAHTLTSESPLHAHARHPRLGGVPRKDTRAFDMGSLSHVLLLGEGKQIEVIDAEDWKTKIAREDRDAARAAGKIPVLTADFEEARDAADSIRQQFEKFGVVLDGESETTAFWTETTRDGRTVQCRGMQDHLKLPTIYDLKSCRSASIGACQRHVDSYGYAIQRAAYVSAIEKIRPDLAGRVDFVFLFFELKFPFAVTPVRLTGEFRELGERRWRRAVDMWERCLREDSWPGYTETIVDLDPPRWALANDMDQQIAAAGYEEDPMAAAE